MAETTDLQADINRFERLWKKFSQENTAVSIARLSLLAASLAAIMALLSWDDSKDAKYMVQHELRVTQDLLTQNREAMDLWRAYTIDLRSEMRARGFEVPPLPEE